MAEGATILPSRVADPGLERPSSLSGWSGPRCHVLCVERLGRLMSPEAARAALELAFSAPSPDLRLELSAEDLSRAWPVVEFLAQAAQRRSEWSRKPCVAALRVPAKAVDAALSRRARAAGLIVRAEFSVSGRPRVDFRAQEAVGLVGPGASRPEAWAKALAGAGVRRVRLDPAPQEVSRGGRGYASFLAGFAAALAEGLDLREEWLSAWFSDGWPASPGLDVLGELCVAPDGTLYTSEAAMGQPALAIGAVGALRWDALGRSPAVLACFSAVHPAHQPLCFHCPNRSWCALPPSENLKRHGTPWGQTPSSSLCRLRMAVFDRLLLEARKSPDFSAWLSGLGASSSWV